MSGWQSNDVLSLFWNSNAASRNRDDLHLPKIQLAVSLCVWLILAFNDSTMIYYTTTLNIAGICEMNLLPRSLGHTRHPYVVIPKAAFCFQSTLTTLLYIYWFCDFYPSSFIERRL